MGTGLLSKALIGRLLPGIGTSRFTAFYSFIHSVHSWSGLSDTRLCGFRPCSPGAHALDDTSVSPSVSSQVWCDSVLQKGDTASLPPGMAAPLNSAVVLP